MGSSAAGSPAPLVNPNAVISSEAVHQLAAAVNAGGAQTRAFDLDRTKARVLRAFEGTAPPKFRAFYKTSTMDKWLKVCARYVGAKLDGREDDADEELKRLAPIYATVLLTLSDFTNTQKDKLFFESFYEATNQVLREAFASSQKVAEAEQQLNQLFRTDRFNIATRRADTKKRHNTHDLTLHELYTVRNEAGNTLNTKLLWELFGLRRRAIRKPVAGITTPLISLFTRSEYAKPEANSGASTARSAVASPRAPAAGGAARGKLPDISPSHRTASRTSRASTHASRLVTPNDTRRPASKASGRAVSTASGAVTVR